MITTRTRASCWGASAFSFKLAAISCLLVLPTIALGVTVTDYDKPPEAKLAPSGAMIQKLQQKLSNLTHAERQKRLLPYINFYLSQNLNQPSNQDPYQTDERYHIIGPLKMNYQPVQTKYSELIGPTYQTNKGYQTEPTIYQPKTKFTPFLESNAIPGPFIPMVRTQPQKIKVSYTPLEQSEKIPNYSIIYDKLSQLKLQQNANYGYKNTYGNAPQYIITRKPQVTFIPVQEFQHQSDYTPVQPQKTYIHSYTPTSLEVPNDAHIKYEPHIYGGEEQIPIKIEHQTEPKQQLQGEIMITQQPIRVTQINNPKQNLQEQTVVNAEPIRLTPHHNNYVPVIAINPQTQYIVQEQKPYHTQSHKQYLQEIIPSSKPPLILIPQKVLPQKQYIEVPKQEPIKIRKPVIILQPAPHPAKPYITDSYQPITTIHQLPEPAPTPAPDIQTENPNSLSQILKKLQDSNTLPQTLTPDNIDNSIKTLVHILNSLKKQQKLAQPIVVADEGSDYEEEEEENNEAGVGLGGTRDEVPGTITEFYPAHTPEGGTPGRPGVDYPALSSIPPTNFNCKTQRYKGFFADPDTHCQVWHYCDLNGGQASFLCPNGTIFSQVALTCDWWFNVKCSSTTQLYVLNERLYKYIIPLTPKFPEDYTGPLVDRYLALKFKEMEEKMKKEKNEKKEKEDKQNEIDEFQLLEGKNTERPAYTTPPEDEDDDEEVDDEHKET